MEVMKLAKVSRGEMVESTHRGVVAVVDVEGRLLANAGDPNYQTFIRSSAKPLQAVPVIEKGVADHFQFREAEIAVINGSHSGEPEHQEAVKGILHKIGLTTANLLCGAPKPFHRPTAQKLAQEGKKPEPVHCPCSGKHAGMLALTMYEQTSIADYYKLEHPTQQAMLQTVAEFCELPKEEIKLGIDGCGVPVFGMSLRAMAQAYANFAMPVKFTQKRQKACQQLSQAIKNNPHLIAGTGRFTTDLLQQAPQIIAKDGGEAVFCLGIPEKGWGIAIKIEDGGARALNPVVLSVLEQLGLLSESAKENLTSYYNPTIKNFRGEVIGRITPNFSLE